MKKEIEAFVNAANEQELEAAWNNLSAEEQRVFEQLMEEEPPEDALAFFAQLYDDAPKERTSETVNISENEIYFKRKPLTEEQKKHSSYVDENGNLHVKNLSAFWIPELCPPTVGLQFGSGHGLPCTWRRCASRLQPLLDQQANVSGSPGLSHSRTAH